MLRLSLEVTDIGLNFLKNLISPLAFYGIYFTDFTIGLILFSFLVIRNVYRSMILP